MTDITTYEQKGIVFRGNVYHAAKPERCTRVMHKNFTERVCVLSNTDDFGKAASTWKHISGESQNSVAHLCLCGMTISNKFFVTNAEGKIIQCGSECVNRINPTLMKDWNESKKIQGECYICKTKVQNLNSHYGHHAHLRKKNTHNEKRKDTLEKMVLNKIERIESLKPKKICYICGPVSDYEEHMESNKERHELNLKHDIMIWKEKMHFILFRHIKKSISLMKATKRLCITCESPIEKNKPAYVIRCVRCYINHVNKRAPRTSHYS